MFVLAMGALWLIIYFFAFTGELMRASGRPIFPEGVFILAAVLRLVTVCIVAGYIVRDVMRPELDVVRRSYEDDPDGGVLDGAPDRWSDSADEEFVGAAYPTG